MNEDEIYSVFDGDPEIALMKLAVSRPDFGRRDLESALRTLASAPSRYLHPAPFSVAFGGGKTPYESSKQTAFRTIFFIMFTCSHWDDMLFHPDFLPFVRGMKKEYACKNKAAGYRDRSVDDVYETFAEMEDRLVRKIRTYSGA